MRNWSNDNHLIKSVDKAFGFNLPSMQPRGGGGGGGTSLLEANGDVPLDGVAFLRLDWLEEGRTFSDFWGKKNSLK